MKLNARLALGLLVAFSLSAVILDPLLGRSDFHSPSARIAAGCSIGFSLALLDAYRKRYGIGIMRATLLMGFLIVLAPGLWLRVDLRPTVLVLIFIAILMEFLWRGARYSR